MRTVLARWKAAFEAFYTNAYETWVVVEDFYPIGRRIVAQFRTYDAASQWLDDNRRGTMRIWTLAEYRRRLIAEVETDAYWADLSSRTADAWWMRQEAMIRDRENLALVANRDPLRTTSNPGQ